MSGDKSPKKVGSLKFEPLKGQYFDIMPAKVGKTPPKLSGRADYFRFALTAFIAFAVLTAGNAYVQGRELVEAGETTARAGYDSIKQGMDSLMKQDSQQASIFFASAQSAFNELSESTRHLTMEASNFRSQNLYLDTASSLVESALAVSEIGQELAQIMQDLSTLPGQILAGGENANVIDLVNAQRVQVNELLVQAASLQRKLTTLNVGLLPSSLSDRIHVAQYQVGSFITALLDVENNFDILLTVLGDTVPHRILVLFQNNHERRATGGFIGSYMIVDINDGKISKMEAKDVYESDGQLVDFVKAPSGISQVASQLYMRDANYSPDFPTSAQDIMWFLEHSKGPSVDTVIAIDQSLVESLITLTGPLRIESLPFQITANNFTDLVSFHTEAKITNSSTPKQLLFDLIPAIKTHLSQLSDLGSVLKLGKDMVQKGHLQVYSNDAKLQALNHRLGISGEMVKADPKTDFLSVITTSIGGNKSDQYMTMDLRHRTEVAENGGLVDQLTIYKTHTWGHEQESKLANLIDTYGTGKQTAEALFFILGRGPNVDYMRVYVPLGSQLQDVQGVPLGSVEVSEDLGYTVFGFTNGPINAGASKKVTLRYQLPFDLAISPIDNYRFIAQKQAGAENITLKKEVLISDYLSIVKNYPDISEPFTLNPVFETAFDKNQIFISAISRS